LRDELLGPRRVDLDVEIDVPFLGRFDCARLRRGSAQPRLCGSIVVIAGRWAAARCERRWRFFVDGRRRRAARATIRFTLGAFGEPLLEHFLALAPECRRGIPEAAERSGEIALVSAVFDFANDALPILLVCVVALDRRFELEPDRRVADLLATKRPQTPVDVLTQDQRLDALDPDEILFVERAQPFNPRLEFVDQLGDLGPST